MKSISYFAFIFICLALFVSSCEKKGYRMGLPEYNNHYYAAYIPNNNSLISVKKTQTDLLKFPVAWYAIETTGISNPAVLGVDFNIVDKNGKVITTTDTVYAMTFAKAKRATDTIYIRLLNNPAPGTRRMEIQIREHATEAYDVDIFSTAYRRPVDIK
jgi:hypothetical protein